jgi:hypothetical protein
MTTSTNNTHLLTTESPAFPPSPSLPLPLSLSAPLPSPESRTPSPPSPRDFEIYEAIHIDGCSTRSQANLHEISQTRVRQIVRRVVEWLGQVIPPQAKVAKEQEVYLARQIAADRFQHQLEQMTELWNETKESKYAGLRMRLTIAQARLGVVSGILDGLAADAIEGLPVPIYAPPPEDKAATIGRGASSSAHAPDDLELTPPSSSSPPYSTPTPSAPVPCSLSPSSFPPSEDCSPSTENPPLDRSRLPPPQTPNPTTSSTCTDTAQHETATKAQPNTTSHPLLTASNSLPITQLQVNPSHTGLTISTHDDSPHSPSPTIPDSYLLPACP